MNRTARRGSSFEDVLERALQDPEVRAIWDRQEIARALSIAILGYRIDHKKSQTQLAEILGLSQPRVARLEMGEYDPTLDTLRKIASTLDWTISVTIKPDGTGSLSKT